MIVEVFTGTTITQRQFTITADRNTGPFFSMLQIVTQIFHNFRMQSLLILSLEFFPIFIYIVIGQFKHMTVTSPLASAVHRRDTSQNTKPRKAEIIPMNKEF